MVSWKDGKQTFAEAQEKIGANRVITVKLDLRYLSADLTQAEADSLRADGFEVREDKQYAAEFRR